jgi:hypothetical protein
VPAPEPASDPAPDAAPDKEPAEAAKPSKREEKQQPQSAGDDDRTLPRCTPRETRRVLARLRPALVSVAGLNGMAHGFVFRSRRQVLTLFDVVSSGRGIEVTLSDGSTVEARILSIDRANNLALLELPRAAPAAPLRVGKALEVGAPHLVIGTPYYGDSPKVVILPGNVTGKVGRHLRTDALEGANLTLGSPVVDCQGQLAAVHAEWFDGRLLAASELERVVDGVGRQPEYTGDWSMAHPSFAASTFFDRSTPDATRWGGGLTLGTALIGEDRWYFPFRLGVFATSPLVDDDGDPNTTHMGVRLTAETAFGYRFMLSGGGMPAYLVPTVGVMGGYEHFASRTSRQVVTQSGCSPETPCDVELETTEAITESWFARPTLGLALQISYMEIGYQLQIQADKPEDSTHVLSFGVQF